jgi:hypothetical protein
MLMQNHLYAVERYDSQHVSGDTAPRLPLSGAARLIGVIQLTDDDIGLALVEGTDRESVRASMTAAGWRVDRIVAASWVVAPGAVR